MTFLSLNGSVRKGLWFTQVFIPTLPLTAQFQVTAQLLLHYSVGTIQGIKRLHFLGSQLTFSEPFIQIYEFLFKGIKLCHINTRMVHIMSQKNYLPTFDTKPNLYHILYLQNKCNQQLASNMKSLGLCKQLHQSPKDDYRTNRQYPQLGILSSIGDLTSPMG